MSKIIVSSFFLLLFTALIAAPTIILVVDDSVDISMFYSLSEEEEKGYETIKSVQVAPSDFNQLDLIFASKLRSDTIGYQFKKYPKPHLNLISPPPERYIL
jgi:hypothetical protein